MINGHHVDPMKVKLPRGRVLEGGQLAAFEQERDRLDNMMSQETRARTAAHGADPIGAATSAPQSTRRITPLLPACR
jgi:hypothetical protein